MTATTTNTTTATDHGSVAADIDTRLMLAAIFMDVRTCSDPAVREARQAASDAIAEAGRYSDQAGRLEAVTRQPEAPCDASILRQAADIIRARGWAQRDYTADNGSVCILQAIHTVTGGPGTASGSALDTLRDRIRREFGEDPSSVPVWNDRPGRTVADVLRILG